MKDCDLYANGQKQYPSECRVAGSTYEGPVNITVDGFVNEDYTETFNVLLGHLPIMVKVRAFFIMFFLYALIKKCFLHLFCKNYYL